MDHEVGPESSSSTACLHTAEYDYLFEGHKVFEYQNEIDLLNGRGI